MKKNLFRTAALVTVLSVAERSLGFLYRIALSRLIGAEGLGLYQVALSVFAVFLTIGTGGFPVTVSRLIAKNKAENDLTGERGTVSAGIVSSLCLTLPVCILFAFFPNMFSFLFSDKRCIPLFSILLFGLSATSVYAVLRGAFWGNKRFLLPSVIELLEEAVMVIVGILLLKNADTNAFDGAKIATYAVIVSYFVSFAVSVIGFFLGGQRLSSPKKELKPLFSTSLPITAVRTCSTLISSAVAVLLPAMLMKNGASESEAVRLFGIVVGMAIPVLSIPSTVIGSVALVLVPELADNFYRKNTEKLSLDIGRGLFVAVSIACLISPVFSVVGMDAGRLLYSEPYAGELIQKSAWLLLPMSVSMITNAVLNSIGFEKQTLVHYFIGAAGMLCCIFFLPAFFGVFSYPLGLGFNFAVTSALNLKLIKKICPVSKTTVKKCLTVIFCSIPCLIFGFLLYDLLCPRFDAVLTLLATASVMSVVSFAEWFVFGIFPTKPNKKRIFEN